MIVVLFFLGLALGSFVNALVWRLRQQGRAKTRKQKDRLSILTGRSMCPHCQHTLEARDLVPVFSWLALRGRCRYCQKPISCHYPLVELLTAGLFVVSYLAWPYDLAGEGLFRFIIWLPVLVILVALFVYDLRWMLLPDKLTYALLAVAGVQVSGIAAIYGGGLTSAVSALIGLGCLGGLFYLLFQVSGGKWIGGGDVKLGFGLGLLAGGALQAIAVLFAASFIGTLVSLALLLAHKVSKKAQVPFGPFLITAFIVVQFFGAAFIEWYRSQFLFF